MTNRILKLTLTLLGIVMGVVFLFLVRSGDVSNHLVWAKYILTSGFANFYSNDFYPFAAPNYPPLILYFFVLSRLLFLVFTNSVWYLNVHIPIFPSNFVHIVQQSPTLEGDFLKLSSLFFMWGTFYILFLFYKQVRKSTGYEFLFLTFFNPFFYYSTALWGQVDIVPLFFLLSALYIYFYQKKYLLFILPLVTVGLLCKQTIIIFLPLLGYLLLKKDKVNFAKGSLLSLVIFILSFLPFAIQSKNLFFYGFATYFQKVVFSSSTQYVTSYAFNLWTLLTNVYNVVDSQKFLFLSFRTLGIIIFSLFYLQAFWVLKQKQNLQHVLYAFFLVGASAFFFLTRMHERHLFQALPFLLILGFKNSKAKKLFIVLSFLHFLNLYYVWNPWRQIFDLGAAPLIVPKLLSFLGLVTLVVFLVQRKCLLSLKSKNDEK